MSKVDLSRVKERDALRATSKADPYWQRLRPGCFLGYCPSSKGGPGAWFVRAYDAERQKYARCVLGSFHDVPGAARFAAAKQAAEQFADQISSGGQLEKRIQTVADACRDFASDRPEVHARFNRYVYFSPIANIRLSQLRRRHLRAWRENLAATPALVSRAAAGSRKTRTRSASTVNRDVAPLRAALACALPLGRPNSEGAWQEALTPAPNATSRRTLYLDREQRRVLVSGVDDEVRPFVVGLCGLPFRPGALARLRVGDFDKRTSELSVERDKTRPRRIKVPATLAALLSAQAGNRHVSEPIFTRRNGRGWDKETWNVSIKMAAISAGLPGNVTVYTLRHSTITDLVAAGLPLLTIAQISGTSAAMIERHYGHLCDQAAVAALDTLALDE